MNKLEKLGELNELLKSNAISQDEFEKLKKEILNEPESSKQETRGKEDTLNKEKITLKSFYTNDEDQILAPKIEYIKVQSVFASYKYPSIFLQI